MRRIASACTALLLLSAACGDPDDPETGPLADSATQTQPALTGGDAAVVGSTLEDGAAPTMPTPVAEAAVVDAGAANNGSDAATKPVRPPIMLEIPKATVECGSSSCDTLKNVCCESWSLGKGFGTSRSCVTRERCYSQFTRTGEQNRAVAHECDGKEDCSGGQVCCLVADGEPLCEFADLAMCTSKVYGPGGGGICADETNCKLGTIRFIAEGVPLGILACNDDVDCQDRAGTRCQPEEDASMSTGRGVKARSYMKVCR